MYYCIGIVLYCIVGIKVDADKISDVFSAIDTEHSNGIRSVSLLVCLFVCWFVCWLVGWLVCH